MDEGVAGKRCVLVPRHVLCAQWCSGDADAGWGRPGGTGAACLRVAAACDGQSRSRPVGKAAAPQHMAQQGHTCAAVAVLCRSYAPKFSPPAAGCSTKRLRRSVWVLVFSVTTLAVAVISQAPRKQLIFVALPPCQALCSDALPCSCWYVCVLLAACAVLHTYAAC